MILESEDIYGLGFTRLVFIGLIVWGSQGSGFGVESFRVTALGFRRRST